MSFPQFKVIDSNIIDTMESRSGENNIGNSGMVPWIRLASGVGNGLVLESVNTKNTFNTEYGGDSKSGKIGRDFDDNPVYAKDDRSLRPSPTIDGITVENGSNGLSRKAKFSIKCHTLKQSNLLSQYFYEPGNVVYVEYGWNTKLSMEQRANLTSGLDTAVCDIVKSNNYETIHSKRTKSNGTFDGFMGYITGGGFMNTDNGGYQLDVELTTLGEIPAYLQPHKTATGKSVVVTPMKDYDDIDPDSDSIADIGISLWRQMWNRLPKSKKIKEVRDLARQSDDRGTKWTDAGNFVNMDTENRELLATGLAGSSAKTSESDVSVPDNMEIFSDTSYIRMELAFEILNKTNVSFDPVESDGCAGDSNQSIVNKISIKDTVIRAHKYMFSLDDKLFIPNRNHPNFDLMKSVFAKKSNDGGAVIGSPSWTITKGVLKLNDGSVSARDQMKMSDLNSPNGDNRYTFPQLEKSTFSGDSDDEDIVAPGNTYGYLKDLYINFEYFKTVLESSNFVAKDIVFEMLNTISMSVNSIWHFELINEGNSLVVKDLSFLGTPPKFPIKTFYTQGKRTNFLTSSIDMKMSAAMRNQILATRQTSPTDIASETQTLSVNSVGSFWSGPPDAVMQKLFSLRPGSEKKAKTSVKKIIGIEFKSSPIIGEETSEFVPPETTSSATGTTTDEKKSSESEDEILEKNLSEFLEYGTIVARTVPPGVTVDSSWWRLLQTDTALDDVFLTTAWNDPTMLKTFETGTHHSPETNGVLLGIEFNFETLGISGLHVGNVFKLADVPLPYSDKIFQIMSTSNSITGTTWRTSVNSQLRNITWD